MKRTATLQVLDEYAKKITKKQAEKLYEAKMNKKYTKKLYENIEEDKYSLYLDNYVLEDNEINASDIVSAVRESFGNNIKIRKAETGIMLSTNERKEYASLLTLTEKAGIPTTVLNNLVDYNYIYE